MAPAHCLGSARCERRGRQSRGRRMVEVHLVWHQAIDPAGDAVSPEALGHQVAVEGLVIRAVKQTQAPVAALRHMMLYIGNGDAGEGRHAGYRARGQQ